MPAVQEQWAYSTAIRYVVSTGFRTHSSLIVALFLGLRRPAFCYEEVRGINLAAFHGVHIAPEEEVEPPCERLLYLHIFPTGSQVVNYDAKGDVSRQSRATRVPSHQQGRLAAAWRLRRYHCCCLRQHLHQARPALQPH